ncbi:IS21 family transposase [Trichloromonas sp.]|jgi:transposase|uniref:IS21 family transposase n=1 Tax=Trichloromonas sp. TaxID=3069249 RepID=UPI002A37F16B|nr:IS21 family transposase [Trichloromonas sp.]
MRKIRETLRLHFDGGLGQRPIARCLAISRTTVGDYLRRADAAGLSWPLPESLTDQQLYNQLFPPTVLISATGRTTPDCAYLHTELKRKGVTLMLLWEEYQAEHPQGYRYSHFCELYRRWARKLKLSMRQIHRAGEKLFVDYAGHTLPLTNPHTGEIAEAQIFVAVLGASNYTFAEVTLSQNLSDWLGSHRRAFEFFGGVPEIVIPDNLKSAVSKPCRYEPDLNPSYQDLAEHYGTAVIPARVRKPKDKSKAEVGVQIVERWILARLRNQTFFSLAEANAAIRNLLIDLNSRPFKKLPGSRKEAFESLDRPALKPLPADGYTFSQWKKVRVGIDYHVEIDGHYYSVPYPLRGKQLDARITANSIECFQQRKRVASHVRSFEKGRHSTVPSHMPKGHQDYADWTPDRLIRWAAKTGPRTAAMTKELLASRQHAQQAFRSAMGLMRLAKVYTPERLEAACDLALDGGAARYKSVKSILSTGLDQQPRQQTLPTSEPIAHDNIRGGHYYH